MVLAVDEGDKKGKRLWMWCECGTVWPSAGQAEIAQEPYDQDYLKDWTDEPQWWMERATYEKRVYMPLIEEMTYGRRILEVGYVHHYGLDWLRDRGWIPFGLDICPGAMPGDHRHATADFLTHEFKQPLDRFDAIWMSHVIEHFKNPMQALHKAYQLLESSGVIFISSPDTDYLHRVGKPGFGHFHSGEHHMMFRNDTFAKLAERIGFTTVLSRKSASRRSISYDQFHYIGFKR